jgi:hypothetical protein
MFLNAARTEPADVLYSLRVFVKPAIGRYVNRDAGVEKAALRVVHTPSNPASFESNTSAEIPSAVALKAAGAIAREEETFPAPCSVRVRNTCFRPKVARYAK